MWGSRPVSVRAAVRRTFTGSIVAIVLASFAGHEYLRRAAWQQAERARAAETAKVIAQQLGSRPDLSAPALLHFCRHLVELPNVLAISIRDDQATDIAAAARMPQLGEQLASTDPGASLLGTVSELAFELSLARRYHPTLSVWVPIVNRVGLQRPLRMGLALKSSTAGVPGLMDISAFFIPVAALAILVQFLARQNLNRRLHGPLQSLVQSAAGEVNAAAVPGDGNAGHELSVVSEALNRLRSERMTWRQRTHLIERRVDSEIAKETRRINQDLRRVQKEAWLDPLTGIYNRRFLQEKFPEIFLAQKNTGRDLTVVMLDLDSFKPLNDCLGHAAGDEMLAYVGDLLRHTIRSDDFAVRYGGDEFLLILPGVSVDMAQSTVERILATFAQRAKMMAPIQPPPTISAGIAGVLRNRPNQASELLGMADTALLSSKQNGKHRVEIFVGTAERLVVSQKGGSKSSHIELEGAKL
jgi:diguanylate cyclase (GGDEF)-like protein